MIYSLRRLTGDRRARDISAGVLLVSTLFCGCGRDSASPQTLGSLLTKTPGMQRIQAIENALLNDGVTKEREGTGALVLPQRALLVQVLEAPDPLLAGQERLFRFGENEPRELMPIVSKLGGLRGGDRVRIESDRPGKLWRLEIRRVCTDGAPLEKGCREASPDAPALNELDQCQTFDEQPCRDLFKALLEAPLDPPYTLLMEYCSVRTQARCRDLISGMIRYGEQVPEGPLIGRLYDLIAPLQPLWDNETLAVFRVGLASSRETLSRWAVSGCLHPLTPESAGILLEALEKGAPASPWIREALSQGLYSSIPGEKQLYEKTLYGLGRYVPPLNPPAPPQYATPSTQESRDDAERVQSEWTRQRQHSAR